MRKVKGALAKKTIADAREVSRLIAQGWTKTDVRKKMGISRQRVYQLIEIAQRLDREKEPLHE